MISQPVRLGILGAGAVVESYHLPVLRHLKDIKIQWISDQNLDRASKLAETFGIPHAAKSIEDCPNVDMVLVAIPVGVRHIYLETIFARRWHAFCEKPFASTLTEHQW